MGWELALAVIILIVLGGLAFAATRRRADDGDARPPSVDVLLARLTGGPPAERADAARQLAPPPELEEAPVLYEAADRIAPAMVTAFEDEDVNVRKWAAWSMAGLVKHERMPAETGVPLLIRALGDDDASVRTYGAFALEKIGRAGKPAIDELERAKREDPKRDVRIAATAALRSLKRYK